MYNRCQNFLPFWGWIIFHCMYIWHFFIPSFIDRHLDCFHLLALMNNTAVNMGLCKCLQDLGFSFLEYIPRSDISESHGSSVFNVLRNWCIFHSDSTILHSYQQCTRVSVSSHPCQHLFVCVCVFLITAILTGVRWHLIVYLHFPDGSWCWASFHISVGHVYVFGGKPVPVLGSFLIISLFIYLCIYLFMLIEL